MIKLTRLISLYPPFGPAFTLPLNPGGPQSGPEWPQSDPVVIAAANIQPDSWGINGPNQTLEKYQALANRNDYVWRAPVVSGVTKRLGHVKWPPNPPGAP